MAENFKVLLWTDIEATGLDPMQETVLEIAVVATDTQLEELGTYHAVLWYGPDQQARLREHNPFVHGMHTMNGLLEECANSPLSAYNVDCQITNMLGYELSFAQKGEFLLAGSGVSHYDRFFIQRYFPQLRDLLHYATLDIGVLRRAVRLLGDPAWVPDMEASHGALKTHRAKDDVKAHLQEGRAYKELFGNLAHFKFAYEGLCK